MGYRLVEVDVTQSVQDLPSTAADCGIALVLRDGKWPVALSFVEPGDTRAPLAAGEPAVMRSAAEVVIQERVRRGLLARRDGPQRLEPETPRTIPGGVTVAVCTRNRPADLGACLDAIASAAGAQAADVLVVDNAPPDDLTYDVAAARPGVRYVREPVAGLDVARNRALAEARGAWVAFVDDDVRVDRWWLDGLAAVLEEHPDAAAVTGLVLPAELDTAAQVRFERSGGFGRGYEQIRWDGRRGPGSPLHPLGAGVFGAGCNMAFDVHRMRELGGFDEALDTGPPLPGGGDLDAFFRVLNAGHVLVYEPRMAVFHRHRRDLDELRRQYYSWGLGFATFLDARWRDPAIRSLIVRMVVWWTRYSTCQVGSAVRQRDREGVRLALAELGGGLVGMTGEYARSRRRMRRRRALITSQAENATAWSR
jgi:glycosyltransferase involved in cell wall biosynthesis